MATLVVKSMPECPILVCQCDTITRDGKVCRRTRDDGCTCIDSEKALRAWAYSDFYRPMTPEQRLWCIAQIDNAFDPMLKIPVSRLVSFSDRFLAGAVLISWFDQCDAINQAEARNERNERGQS